MNVNDLINELVGYGINKNLITIDDSIYVINQLLRVLKVCKYDGKFSIPQNIRDISLILDDILDFAITNKLIENSITEKDIFDTLIMDIFTPYPSVIINKFYGFEDKEKATDYFYKLSIDSNYIRMNRINKNIKWLSASDYGNVEITINMSKPEKDPKEIMQFKALERNNQDKYPKCLLCYENIGYAGFGNHPARNNLRVIPVTLSNDEFYFQYSPYVYYNEHCIVFKREHDPMLMCHKTFARLLDFVDMYPHYFIGSNASLPIVGGSILSHEHYQGGRYYFPLDNAKVISTKNSGSVKIELLHWPLTTIRISSSSREDIYDMACKVLDKWQNYTNEKINVIAKTDEIHNSVTPIVRKIEGVYSIVISLRNNLVTKDKPYGLYHPREELFHIKKENIGLIEVMGLAILPARLKTELEILNDILTGKRSEKDLSLIEKHRDWYYELKEKDNIDLKDEVGRKFIKVLEDCNVFKYGSLDDIESFIKKLI